LQLSPHNIVETVGEMFFLLILIRHPAKICLMGKGVIVPESVEPSIILVLSGKATNSRQMAGLGQSLATGNDEGHLLQTVPDRVHHTLHGGHYRYGEG